MKKSEVKVLTGSVIHAQCNQNQFENIFIDHDKDQDDYLTRDEVLCFIIMMAT